MDAKKLNELLNTTREQNFRKKEQWKIDLANRNKAREGTEEWKKVIKTRDYSHTQTKEWKERSRQVKLQQLSDPVWKENFDKKMQEVYKSEKFLNSCLEKNRDPERNKKISQALSTQVQTPDGLFDSIAKCAEFYNISSEGVRYRCKTNPNWQQLKPGKASTSTKKKLSKSAKETKNKRLESIAKSKGYIYTPQGKFLSVREAWRAELEVDLTIIKNSHFWFKDACARNPKKYYKK
jgi:hypothetical protein